MDKPKNDERIWENKALREARESSHKNAVTILDIAERLGLLKHVKNLDELFTEFNGIRNMLFDHIYQDMPLHADELFQNASQTPETPRPEHPKEEPRDATPKMKSCIWALVYGNDGDLELEEELKIMGLDKNLTKMFIPYAWAHDFIDKYKKPP